MKKILVIEDDSGIRDSICQVLETEGYRVISAENGSLGVKLAYEAEPDIILCDVVMPEMDGYAVIEKIRNNPATETTPFIFLTGKSDPVEIRKGMNLGADDYLYKPFTVEELLSAVLLRLKKNEALMQRTEKKMNELRDSIGFSLPHELNTPLAAILGFAETIQTDFEVLGAEDVKEMAGYIMESAGRLRATIKKFLMFTHLQIISENPEERKRLKQRTCPISPQAIQSMLRNCNKKHLRENDVIVDVDPAEIAVQYDYLLVMLTEVLDNSFKFSVPGEKVYITGKKDDGKYRLEIRDEGAGMTKEQIEHMGAFVQFNRNKQEQQGSGLGLASAKMAAELFNTGFMLKPNGKKGLIAEFQFKITVKKFVTMA